MSNLEPSVLYIVATPIGNLSDITNRALTVLGGVDAIFAEDTRVTGILCDRYQIGTPRFSYREAAPRPQVEKTIQQLCKRLAAGQSVAYVSDAGTPGLSDPGDYLVQQVRLQGYKVVPIPGASAVTTLLSVAGLGVKRPMFVGFLPRKKGHQTLMSQLKQALVAGPADSLIFFEAAPRVNKLLAELEGWGLDLELAVARELTKKFETVMTGSLATMQSFIAEQPPRGEFVILVRVS